MKTAAKKEFYTVSEMREALKERGVEWTEIWIRLQISDGKIKSEKKYRSRLIPREEVERIIRDRIKSREEF